MKSKIKIFTSRVSANNIKRIEALNILPVFIIRNISNSRLIGKYSGSALHFRELAPSSNLLKEFRTGNISFLDYAKRYTIEISNIDLYKIIKQFESLLSLSEAKSIALMGYGEYEESNRKILLDILNISNLLENVVEEIKL